MHIVIMDKLQQAFQSGFQKEAQKNQDQNLLGNIKTDNLENLESINLSTHPYDLGIASNIDGRSRVSQALSQGVIESGLGSGAIAGGAGAIAGRGPIGIAKDVYDDTPKAVGKAVGGRFSDITGIGLKNGELVTHSPPKLGKMMKGFGKTAPIAAGAAAGLTGLYNLGQYGFGQGISELDNLINEEEDSK